MVKPLLLSTLFFLGAISMGGISFAGSSSCTTDVLEYNILTECYSSTECTNDGDASNVTMNEFNTYRQDFIMDSFYTDTVEPDFKSFIDEIRNPFLFKAATIGAFLDASVLNNTLRDLQVSSAQSLQSYTPSEQICRFGTMSRSLASSEDRVNLDRIALSEAGLSRNLGTRFSAAAAGRGQDNQVRIELFVDKYCDLAENASGMDNLCKIAAADRVADTNWDRDVDYSRLMDSLPTIDANLTDSNLTRNETNVIALGNHLYGAQQIKKRTSLAEITEVPGSLDLYAEYRSVVARRAAAQNSYNTLAAMRMAGSGASDAYIQAMLKQIGVADPDTYLKAKTSENAAVNSSYNAQMGFLTKQLYEDPSFYANLMDSKANVKRTSAALQGIGLMQARDTYKSLNRSEMLLALLAEMEARKLVNNYQGAKSD